MKRLVVICMTLPVLAAASCEARPEPKKPEPAHSTLCGTGPDGLIWCRVPAPSDPMGGK